MFKVIIVNVRLGALVELWCYLVAANIFSGVVCANDMHVTYCMPRRKQRRELSLRLVELVVLRAAYSSAWTTILDGVLGNLDRRCTDGSANDAAARDRAVDVLLSSQWTSHDAHTHTVLRAIGVLLTPSAVCLLVLVSLHMHSTGHFPRGIFDALLRYPTQLVCDEPCMPLHMRVDIPWEDALREQPTW